MKVSLTVWERAVLIGVMNYAPATVRTKPGVLAIQDIQAKLQLTDKEKEKVGYIEFPDGRATWADLDYQEEVEFTAAEWYYIKQSEKWGGWPTSENSNVLWEKLE